MHSLDTDEIVNIFAKNRIHLDNFHHLTEQDLIKLGVSQWGSRISILEAIKVHQRQMTTVEAPKQEPPPTATTTTATSPLGLINLGPIHSPMPLVGFGGVGLNTGQLHSFNSRLETKLDETKDEESGKRSYFLLTS